MGLQADVRQTYGFIHFIQCCLMFSTHVPILPRNGEKFSLAGWTSPSAITEYEFNIHQWGTELGKTTLLSSTWECQIKTHVFCFNPGNKKDAFNSTITGVLQLFFCSDSWLVDDLRKVDCPFYQNYRTHTPPFLTWLTVCGKDSHHPTILVCFFST